MIDKSKEVVILSDFPQQRKRRSTSSPLEAVKDEGHKIWASFPTTATTITAIIFIINCRVGALPTKFMLLEMYFVMSATLVNKLLASFLIMSLERLFLMRPLKYVVIDYGEWQHSRTERWQHW